MRKGTISIILGLLLVAAALGISGYNLWDSHRASQSAEIVLKEITPHIKPDPAPPKGRVLPDSKGNIPEGTAELVEYPDYVLNPDMDMPVSVVDGNAYVGIINIPSLGITLPVFNEWSYPNLKISPCRYVGTAYKDNMVICAHNYDAHFGQIKNLSYGDNVIFTDMDGNEFLYTVCEITTLRPTAIDDMVSSDYDLSLFTCTIGGRTRVTVRCNKVS